MKALTTAQSRELDRLAVQLYGVPSIVLMENAGRSVADAVVRMVGPPSRILVLCGPGNNGGDGFVIARHLHNRDYIVSVLLLAKASELKGDALTNYHIINRTRVAIKEIEDIGQGQGELESAELIVDALLGTGLKGEVREPFLSAIRILNGLGKPVVAVDVPSGLDADTGLPLGSAVRATKTITFVAQKLGFLNDSAKEYLGKLLIGDIGIPKEALNEFRVSDEPAE